MIIYSKNSGLNNSAIGKLETPIKMIIEHESDLLTKKGGICSWLFNIEKSHRFGETVIGQGCVIGSSAFITKSVPPCTTVTMKTQELQMKPQGNCSSGCTNCLENK